MFTGIVQSLARVADARPTKAGVRLTIKCEKPPGAAPVRPGDSVCVSGVCLTVAAVERGRLEFDVIPETLAKTTLGSLETGCKVNLEASLTPQTPMSGHFVQGHVEGVGTVVDAKREGGEVRLSIEPPPELMAYIITKGSVALDGVSMTVAAVSGSRFEVALIPTTIERTTLGAAQRGTKLNIETDIISRTVVSTLDRMCPAGRGVTLDTLRRAGFVG